MLKLNVGASRKLTDNNYGSRGASINLELELDTSLAGDPDRLRDKIRQLFGLARTALAEELGAPAHPVDSPAREIGPPAGEEVRRATPSQVKALHAIARAQGVDLAKFLAEKFGTRRADQLQLRQASRAIDDLKSAAAA